MSLYKEENKIQYEMEQSASDLKNNAIMQEFDAMYHTK